LDIGQGMIEHAGMAVQKSADAVTVYYESLVVTVPFHMGLRQ
jgi:hypothetical protein